jgi:hypothetical protein
LTVVMMPINIGIVNMPISIVLIEVRHESSYLKLMFTKQLLNAAN